MKKGTENKVSAFLNKRKPSVLLSILTLPLATIFWEFAVRLFVFNFPIDMGLLYVPLISFTIGIILNCIGLLFSKIGKQIFYIAVLAFGSFYSAFFSIYFNILRSLFSWRNLRFANAVTDFFSVMVDGILKNFYMIIVCFLPLILFLIFRKRYFALPNRFALLHSTCSITSIFLAAVMAFIIGYIPDNRSTFLYIKNDFAKCFRYYGVATTTVNEIAQIFFGAPEEKVENPYLDPSINIGNESTESIEGEEVIEYGENSLNIDFETLIDNAPNETIADMHSYFASVPSTKKNQYTGFFEGKNLIFLTLEGFSSKVIDPQLTPTLYKMYNEGFKFTEYYDIMWGGSTASGEYANMTGNFYTAATCHINSASTLQYSAMGNLFKNKGYSTYAYHNHTYTYYSRNLSHPNFGYTYKGIGNGLELETNSWPKSDLEMAKATVADYINSDGPFHAYYMTVSGHNNYNWNDNMMCSRHRYDIPEDFPFSNEHIKAYFACQLEVDLMLTELIDQLEAAGKLEDTVFAMACDHYPYALTDAELAELYGLPEENIRMNFDLYRNGFILWSASMEEPIVVDTPCSSYDIIPTLANLFGIDYESKVITGKDILSDSEKIVIINDDGKGSSWNWITDKGRYNTATKEFIPSETCKLTQEELNEYIRITNLKVRAMRKYSLDILDQNYYSYVFNSDGTPKITKQ